MNLKSLVPWSRDRGNVPARFTNDSPIFAMQRDMDRVFDDFFGSMSMGQLGWPRVDVRENDREFKVSAELPGLEERDLEITYADGVVTLRGEKRLEEDTALYSERWGGAFERQIVLGDDVDPDNSKATFRNGVLTVTFAKKPEAQRQVKRIAIN
jgi:HSP20 family protein